MRGRIATESKKRIPTMITSLQDGWTPLHSAASVDNIEIVALLLATLGVDPLALYVSVYIVRGRSTGSISRAHQPYNCRLTRARRHLMQRGETATGVLPQQRCSRRIPEWQRRWHPRF